MNSATYSPEDNKLRLYPDNRLDPGTYEKVKAAGFKWAPKQQLFIAPMWTPDREDLMIELCGEIEDEDKSLVERAEERADRFEEYSDNRENDAEQARKAVSEIADNIPLGQPILIGHHSEKHARKDAARIENGMRRSIKMWEQSKYWEQRAKGAIRAAKYKERPDVRARRIKTLGAEMRKVVRGRNDAEMWLKAWSRENLTIEQARGIANICHLYIDNTYRFCAWDALQTDENRYKDCPAMTVEQLKARAKVVYPRKIANCDRWINHYKNRIAYEIAMLGEAGGIEADRNKPEKGGGCKCWASPRDGWNYIIKVNKISVTVLDNWGNGGSNFTRNIPFDKLKRILLAADVAEKKAAGTLKETEDKRGFYLVDEDGPAAAVKAKETGAERNQRLHDEAVSTGQL